MKSVLIGAIIVNGIIGTYNMTFASMSWGVFNFMTAAVCAYSYLQWKDL